MAHTDNIFFKVVKEHRRNYSVFSFAGTWVNSFVPEFDERKFETEEEMNDYIKWLESIGFREKEKAIRYVFY